MQLVPLYMAWNIGRAVVTGASVWDYFLEAFGFGLTYVLWVGYAHVGLARGLTRLCRWAGCVRAPTHASATWRALQQTNALLIARYARTN